MGGRLEEPPVHLQQLGEATREPHPLPCTSTQEPGEFLPPSAHPNADEQLAGPCPSPGSPARPATRMCMARTLPLSSVSFQASIPPAFGFP